MFGALVGVAHAKGPKSLQMAGIGFDVIGHGRSKHRYLHIHGNESTARDVLREHMKSFKGQAFLVQSDKRMVPVGECVIDPNRMYTAVGARKSLERWNKDKTPTQFDAAMALLARDREQFVKAVSPPKGGRLVAMHNNSEGYSMLEELAISDKVHQPKKVEPHEFMLATNEEDFERLARGAFNVVLQKTVKEDDGRFSVLAAGKGIRYVNIEAAIGNAAGQRAMLEFLEKALK